MFVWLLHRISGLILIVLITIKIITGYGILGRYGDVAIEIMRDWHRSVSLDLATIGLFIYHGLYGVRACLIDLGLRQEKILLEIFTVVGTILFLWFSWWVI